MTNNNIFLPFPNQMKTKMTNNITNTINKKQLQVLFNIVNHNIESLQWNREIDLDDINKMKAAMLANSNLILPCVVESSEHHSLIVKAEMTSLRTFYGDDNKITDIWGYFKTKDEAIQGKIVKFIVLIDNDTNTIKLMLND